MTAKWLYLEARAASKPAAVPGKPPTPEGGMTETIISWVETKSRSTAADVVVRMASPTQLAEADFPAELGRPALARSQRTTAAALTPPGFHEGRVESFPACKAEATRIS